MHNLVASLGVQTVLIVDEKYEIRFLPGKGGYCIHDMSSADDDSYLDEAGFSVISHKEIKVFAAEDEAVVALVNFGFSEIC